MRKKRRLREKLAAPFHIVGNWVAGESDTPIYPVEGATPTLRKLKTVTTSGTGLICDLS